MKTKNLFLFNAYDNKNMRDFHFYRESYTKKVEKRKYHRVIEEMKKRRPDDYHIILYCQQVDPHTYDNIGDKVIIEEFRYGEN
jgi:hypothetical protein